MVKSLRWSNKVQIKKAAAYVFGFLIVLVIVFFKLRPYFEDKPLVRVFLNGKDSDQTNKKIPELDGKHIADSINNKGVLGQLFGSRPNGGGSATGTKGIERPKSFIIERPLFDGAMVTLKAVLTQAISSNQGSPVVEAKLLDGSALGSSYEVSFLKNASLSGSGSPNFDNKRYNFQFSDLVTDAGKHYSVVAFAFDEDSQSVGVQANYSSGIGARVAGSVLSRGIQLGEDVATARVLTNSGSGDSVASMEMNRAVLDTSHQASGDVSDEATAGLRSTRPELSVPAGTVFTLKLKASSTSRGGGQ